MGGQGAKRTIDGDVDADSGEAGDGTGNRYGRGSWSRKRAGLAGQFVGGRKGNQPGLRLEV